MMLAEKIVTAIDRGDQNPRWRDFVDIASIAATRRIRADDLRTAITTVASYRQIELRPLGELLARMPGVAQQKWAVWRRRQRMEETTPEQFGDLLRACAAFADPTLEHAPDGVWDPVAQEWTPTGSEQ